MNRHVQSYVRSCTQAIPLGVTVIHHYHVQFVNALAPQVSASYEFSYENLCLPPIVDTIGVLLTTFGGNHIQQETQCERNQREERERVKSLRHATAPLVWRVGPVHEVAVSIHLEIAGIYDGIFNDVVVWDTILVAAGVAAETTCEGLGGHKTVSILEDGIQA